MKAIILTSILAMLSLTNVVAGNTKTKVFSNVENHKSGYTKEYVIADKDLKPDQRMVFEFDANDALISRTFYKWSSKEGCWGAMHKHNYEYNEIGQLTNVIFTKWDRKMQRWSLKSQHLLHMYNLDGKLLSTKQVDVNREMIAEK